MKKLLPPQPIQYTTPEGTTLTLFEEEWGDFNRNPEDYRNVNTEIQPDRSGLQNISDEQYKQRELDFLKGCQNAFWKEHTPVSKPKEKSLLQKLIDKILNFKLFIFLLLSVFIFSCHNSFSQSKFSFGIKAGYINSWNGSPGISYDYKTIDKAHRNSFGGGVFATYSLSKKLSLEANLLFSERGYNASSVQLYDNSGNKSEMTGKQNYNFSYLDLPAYLKYSFGKKIMPFLGLGAALSYNLSHHYGNYVSPQNKPELIYGSLVATGGLTYKRITFQAMFLAGITSAVKSGNSTMSQNYSNSSYGITVINYMDHGHGYPSYNTPTTIKASHLNSLSFLIAYKF
jgi:hypothetical protein